MPVGKNSGVAKYTAPTPQQTAAAAATTDGGALPGDFTEFLKLVAKSPALITGYSKVLKAAGYYKGKITGKYNVALQQALTRAETERVSINVISPITRDQFFAQLEPVFVLIKECEDGRDVTSLLDGPTCSSGFKRLN